MKPGLLKNFLKNVSGGVSCKFLELSTSGTGANNIKNINEVRRMKKEEAKKEMEKLLTEVPNFIEVKGLYGLGITIAEYEGFKNVHMDIFRWNTDIVPFDPVKYVPKNVPKNEAVLENLKEHFTLDEIKQIKEYLSTFPKTTIGEPCPCRLPEEGNVLPIGHIPTGGGQDFYQFFKQKNYSLLFDISGYYDLRRHERIAPK